VLDLHFIKTDYYSQQVTDRDELDTERNQISLNFDITQQPVQFFSTIVGVNLNVITSDNFLVVSLGSQYIRYGAGMYHATIGEGYIFPKDALKPEEVTVVECINAPNVFRTASRGIKEELGVDVDPRDITFHSFFTLPIECSYGLLGTLRINKTSAALVESWKNAIDKHEKERLEFVMFKPDKLAEFAVKNWDMWTPQGILGVYHSLLTIYDKKEVADEFSSAWKNIKTQRHSQYNS